MQEGVVVSFFQVEQADQGATVTRDGIGYITDDVFDACNIDRIAQAYITHDAADSATRLIIDFLRFWQFFCHRGSGRRGSLVPFLARRRVTELLHTFVNLLPDLNSAGSVSVIQPFAGINI